jgi:hypothetical protein
VTRWAAVGLALDVILFAQPVWAQLEQEEPQARWVLPYALVALLIGLALYSICRPSTRRKRS